MTSVSVIQLYLKDTEILSFRYRLFYPHYFRFFTPFR